MEQKIDIYHAEKYWKNIEAKFRDSDICERNKEIVLEFLKYKARAQDISRGRRIKYLCNLRILAEHLNKPFDELNKLDITNFLDKLPTIPIYRGRTQKFMSKATIEDYTIQLNQILLFLEKEKGLPVKAEWAKKMNRDKPKRLRPDEILQWEDIIKLSQSANNPRDKALVQVLWDSGARIGELLTLFIKDVEFMDNVSAVKLNFRESKTDIRSPLIVKSAPALISWLQTHPRRNDKDAPLWIKLNKPTQPMGYNTVRKVLIELKKLSKIEKPVNPHSFRKSSASYYSHKGFTEFEIKKRFGWVQDSKMLSTYIFPDEDRINNKMLEMEGIKITKNKEEKEEKPQKCNWCNTTNPAGDEFCINCKRPLKEEKIIASCNLTNSISETSKEFLEKNPDFFNAYISFLENKIKTEKGKS